MHSGADIDSFASDHAELPHKANRIANVQVIDLDVVPGNAVLLRARDNLGLAPKFIVNSTLRCVEGANGLPCKNPNLNFRRNDQ